MKINGVEYEIEYYNEDIVLIDKESLKSIAYLGGYTDLRSEGIDRMGKEIPDGSDDTTLDYSEAELNQFIHDNRDEFIVRHFNKFQKCE